MKVAFCIRPEYDNPLGGDAIQMLKTKEYLVKEFNISIEIVTDSNEISKKYDIVHVFNFSTYKISKKFIQKAIELKIPVVSSPIYWDYSYASTAKLFHLLPCLNYLDEFTIGFFRKIVLLCGHFFTKPVVVSSAFKKNAKWMFDKSTFIAPNSLEEAKLLLKCLKVENSKKIRVVYNATDKINSQANVDEDMFHKKYGLPKDYILQVGRIEYCKNQLNLLFALRNNPEIPIIFVGKVWDIWYYKRLKKIADKRGNVFFIDAVPHNDINTFYKYAKLHVLLSLRESPGLVNIEALANDCPIVISDKRFLPVETYFANQPYVVNPLNINEIKAVVLKAYYNKKNLAPFDFEKFSWDNVANQTYNIYKEILE
ncbi:MAG: glycosyltransferase family 4 protein [Bacteroidales bacterium]|nr:glycosyltransferase family 4 protein [Bacteroidales bacterium]